MINVNNLIEDNKYFLKPDFLLKIVKVGTKATKLSTIFNY